MDKKFIKKDLKKQENSNNSNDELLISDLNKEISELNLNSELLLEESDKELNINMNNSQITENISDQLSHKSANKLTNKLDDFLSNSKDLELPLDLNILPLNNDLTIEKSNIDIETQKYLENEKTIEIDNELIKVLNLIKD